MLGVAGGIAKGYLNLMGTNFEELASGIARGNMKKFAPDFVEQAIGLNIAKDIADDGLKDVYKNMTSKMGRALKITNPDQLTETMSKNMYDIMSSYAKDNDDVKKRLGKILDNKDGFHDVIKKSLGADSGFTANMRALVPDSAEKTISEQALKAGLQSTNAKERAASYLGAGSAYFAGSGFKKGAARVGTAYAGINAIGMVGRGLGGGDLTHNTKGERDIAGIPFI